MAQALVAASAAWHDACRLFGTLGRERTWEKSAPSGARQTDKLAARRSSGGHRAQYRGADQTPGAGAIRDQSSGQAGRRDHVVRGQHEVRVFAPRDLRHVDRGEPAVVAVSGCVSSSWSREKSSVSTQTRLAAASPAPSLGASTTSAFEALDSCASFTSDVVGHAHVDSSSHDLVEHLWSHRLYHVLVETGLACAALVRVGAVPCECHQPRGPIDETS